MFKNYFYLFTFFSIFFSKVTTYENSTEEQFEGEEYWDPDSIGLCDHPSLDTKWQWKHAVCFQYLIDFQVVNMEILSWNPGLVVYRDLFTNKQVDDYLELMKLHDFEEQEVVNNDGSYFVSKVRRANGTQVIADHFPASRSIFNTVKTTIPNINFKSAEEIIALSYHPNGHYAPHHDYLIYLSEKEWDGWMRNYGNRFATLIMVFKTADRGGATVFPQLGTAVRPQAGDAFFWFNANADGTQEDLSEHGGCPIYEGTKVISTIWVRMKNQPIMDNLLSPGSIPARFLIPGTIRNRISSY